MIPLPLLMFLKNNWEAIAIALLVGASIFYVHHLKVQRDEALSELSVLKLTYNIQKKENDIKQQTAVVSQKASEAIASKQITDLNIDRETLQNAIQGYYETKPNKYSVGSTGGIVLSHTTSGSTTETPSITEGLTGGGQVPDTTCSGLSTQLGTLQEATALETVLYNKARARIDQDCAQIGCED